MVRAHCVRAPLWKTRYPYKLQQQLQRGLGRRACSVDKVGLSELCKKRGIPKVVMDPQKRHLKKLKRLQKLRKEKLKEKSVKKKPKKKTEDVEEPEIKEHAVANGNGEG